MKLSAVIITLNEAKNLPRCLDSIEKIADEIVVLDSLSTDNTKEICLERGVKFFEQKFAGYIKQKNDAAQKASNNWILNIDADEVLSEELQNSILEVKNQPKKDGYTLDRLTNYCGKWIRHCSWYPDKQLRLYDRTKGEFEGKYIHEKVVIKSGKVGHLSGDMLHYSYTSIHQHIAQADKFTELTALEAFENGKKVGILGILIKPGFKFFRNYIIKLGFLDGYYGYVVCKISAFATYLKYTKLRELNKKKHDNS